jgi:hypothetical protein
MEQIIASSQQNALEKQHLTFECSVEDLLSLLECSPLAETARSPRTTRDTAWTPRNMCDAACQTNDVTPSMKKTADSKKRHDKRERATYRERQRLGTLNDAFRRLKDVVPSAHEQTRKLDVLKMASQYIKDMTLMLTESSET